MSAGGSTRRAVVPHTSGTGAAIAPRAMDSTKDMARFLVAVSVGAAVIVVVGLVGILLS